MRKCCFALLFINVIYGCSKQNEREYFSTSSLPININERNSPAILYYFSGNCSICYGNIAHVESLFPDVKLICVSSSSDTLLVNEYMSRINFSGTVLFDDNYRFFDENHDLLKSNKWFCLGNNSEVLFKTSELLDKSSIKIFEKNINKILLKR